ncbi:MAG: polysaccharide deacetylase family protein, partial [Thiotrichaceae bacterium]|nr:polysaccharide deacetylase family protein [Thiotrichaceae bacterium]
SAYVEKETIDSLKANAVPLSWGDARELEKHGISFGPHTISHVILSKCSDEHAHEQIQGSWNMLTQQLEQPCPIFAYPTGRKEDFSGRDIKYIKQIGLLGAVTAEPGCVNFNDITEADNYLIKRMSFPSSIEDLIQYSSGLELIKQNVRDFKLKLKYTTKKN